MTEEEAAAYFDDADMRAFPLYRLLRPKTGQMPFLCNIPHSGRRYPRAFMAGTRLNRHSIRASEDCYVDLLFRSAVSAGASVMAANFPRVYVDVNRPAAALDGVLLRGAEQREEADAAGSAALRAGFGVVPRNAAPGSAIYPGKLPLEEALARLIGCYFPYHAALLAELLRLRQIFGEAVLLDCHSMPSPAAHYPGSAAPDIILGDCFGQACSPQLADMAQSLLERLGYRVARNRPYAGGHITAYYGRPQAGIQALQVEINRALYLSPRTLRPKPAFAALQADMSRFVSGLMALWQEEQPAQAAE